MSEQSLNGGLSWHRVRISSDPDQMPTGVAVSVVDAETGEPISQVFRAVITLDAEDVNKAEITYYESDEPVIHTVTSNDPEVDITAFEVKPALEPKHDGWLDKDRCHQVHYSVFMGVCEVLIGDGCRDESVSLSPQEALSLFAWLQQEKPTLERLAKEAQSERG